jgi:hypothetical protein
MASSNPAGGMDVCVVSKDQKAKYKTIKTKKEVRMKYMVQENKKDSVGAKPFRTRPDLPWGPTQPSVHGYRIILEEKAAVAWR